MSVDARISLIDLFNLATAVAGVPADATGHRDEMLHRVLTEVLVERRSDRQQPRRADQQRVAIGLGLRYAGCADRAACTARPVVDDDRLAERRRQSLGKGTGDEIEIRAGRKWDHNGNRPRRIRLGDGGVGTGERREPDNDRNESLFQKHGVLQSKKLWVHSKTTTEPLGSMVARRAARRAINERDKR